VSWSARFVLIVRAFYRSRAAAGFETCGSPGEVSNDPALRHLAYLYTQDGTSNQGVGQMLDGHDTSISRTRYLAFINTALGARDQLRQRVAWALSQVFVLNVAGFGNANEAESYATFYDIFVRHAFGNYLDILKEVSYSPAMGKMLTFLGGKSYAFSGSFPDENYAREVMQLFTIGLDKLHMNGTLVLNDDGSPVPTYDNSHIMAFSRAWTGFDSQPLRANIEVRWNINYLDPMQVKQSAPSSARGCARVCSLGFRNATFKKSTWLLSQSSLKHSFTRNYSLRRSSTRGATCILSPTSATRTSGTGTPSAGTCPPRRS